jgi:membrane protein insertase, YidC/Oxa1 family, N-terminal domain
MNDNKNLVLAVVLSVLILVGWQIAFPPPEPVDQPVAQATTQQSARQDASGDRLAPSTPDISVSDLVRDAKSREEIVAGDERVNINEELVRGSISLKGAAIDDIVLTQYRETIEKDSDNIVLLSPKGSEMPFFARFGWSLVAGKGSLPGANDMWQQTSSCGDLSAECDLALLWNGPDGLSVKRTISTDKTYMLTIQDEVINQTDATLSVAPYGLLRRVGLPQLENFYIAHEGFIGVANEVLEEVDYDDVYEDGDQSFSATGGWVGITDKYWMATLIPDQSSKNITKMRADRQANIATFQAEYVGEDLQIPAGGSTSYTHRLFAGAKVVGFIDGYAEEGIQRFDLSIDWGWFFFLTKPMFLALDILFKFVGNFGVAILILTVLIKAVFFPLANTSYKAMSKMKALTPEMTKIRERYKDDREKLQKETMALYKKEKVNPVTGCLPMLIQIPFFFALYKVLFTTIEMRHAPFFGWIQDLSAPDPTSIFNLFGLLPYELPGFLMIGVWPILMGLTMYFQQKLNPPPADPTQAQIFAFLPLVFTFMLATFSAGLVIYWTWNNLLSILQQAVIMKRMGVPLELHIGLFKKKKAAD